MTMRRRDEFRLLRFEQATLRAHLTQHQYGAISENTTLVGRLLDAAERLLEDVLPAAATELRAHRNEVSRLNADEYAACRTEDEAERAGRMCVENNEFLWQEVEAEFNDAAPDGMYFGAAPGDGTLIGWWKVGD